MTDDSQSSPGADAPPPPPPPVEPDRTAVRPAEPQPPAGAIDDGDGDDGDATAPRDPAATTVVATAPQTAWIGDGGGGGTPPEGPVDPEFPVRASRAGSAGAIVALGTGLLAAAVAIGAVRARSDGDLDWSNYGVALGATAVLLFIAVLGSLAGRVTGGRAREEVVTWPGVVGILATAVLIGVGIDQDDSWVAYLIGGVLVVLGALGYVAARRAAFVVVAILGLAIVYGVAFDELVADSIGDGHPEVVGAVLVALFVVVVTLLGWVLPSRAVTGVVVGVAGLVGFVGILLTFVASRFFLGLFGPVMFAGAEDDLGGFDPSTLSGPGFDEADVWWVLALAGLLVVLWALAAAVSNHSGFAILAIATPAILVPLASLALAAEHPTWWAAIVASAGGVLLLGGWFVARLRERRTASEITV